ncbi:hypothetical protein [Streptomyces daliensis]
MITQGIVPAVMIASGAERLAPEADAPDGAEARGATCLPLAQHGENFT